MWKVHEVETKSDSFVVWLRSDAGDYRAVIATTADKAIAEAESRIMALDSKADEIAAEAEKVRSFYGLGYDPATEQEAASAAADVQEDVTC